MTASAGSRAGSVFRTVGVLALAVMLTGCVNAQQKRAGFHRGSRVLRERRGRAVPGEAARGQAR